jgi:hypothetical protein
MVMADLSLFCSKESLGDGGFLGDGRVLDDGVATKTSLIGVLAAASKSVAMLGFCNGRIKCVEEGHHPRQGEKLYLRGDTYKAIHGRWLWFGGSVRPQQRYSNS